MSSFNLKEAESYSKNGQSLTKYIENFTKPVIASVNGFALGGGCEFAMSCHIRYAADNAKFGQPEVGLGLIAGFGGTQRLSRLVGKGHALEILLSGKMISASEAESIGLINKVFPSDDLFEEVMDLAKKISQNAPISVKHTIKLVNNGLDSSLNEGLDLESKAFGDIFSTDDQKEGITAFIEKRSANFKGT
jgi:enoyl-CoA hydratase